MDNWHINRAAGLAVCGCFSVVLSLPAVAQWSGSVTVDAATQSVDDSKESFRTQYNLDDGIGLGSVDLTRTFESKSKLRIKAQGFGSIDPVRKASLKFDAAGPWQLGLQYDRRESFFALDAFEEGRRRDDWRIERWRAYGKYSGFDFADLEIEYRQGTRQGQVQRPFFGLNNLYPLNVGLDEEMRELTVRLDRTSGPLHLLLEQRFAQNEYHNSWAPVDDESLLGADPDLFVGATRDINEALDIPTTRLVASWSGTRAEFAGSVLYSPAELEGYGSSAAFFEIDGGGVGQLGWLDEQRFFSDRDQLALSASGAVALSERAVLNVRIDHRDSESNGSITAQQLLRVISPLTGTGDFATDFDARTRYDVSDTDLRADLRFHFNKYELWFGATTTSRDVEGRTNPDDEPFDRQRDRDGLVLGASAKWGGWRAKAEFETSDFDDSIFRTDPQDADRLTVRLRGPLSDTVTLNANARIFSADNDVSLSNLDQSSDALGLGVNWAHPEGVAGAGVAIDWLDLETETSLVLPGGGPGLSIYDVQLLTATIHAHVDIDRLRLSGAVTRIDESGDTWPLESRTASVRLDYRLDEQWTVGVFTNYWSYDDERSATDDYNVSRLGLRVTWRLP